jgi:hypothetical protein
MLIEWYYNADISSLYQPKLQTLDRCISGPFHKFYNIVNSNWMFSNPGKPISIYTAAHLIGMAYPGAFRPSNIRSGFCLIDLCPINCDIFTEHKCLSPYIMDMPETAVQESVNAVDQPLSAQTDEPLAPKA